MEVSFDLNIWAWILIGLQVLNLVIEPRMFGKEREPYSYKVWIIGLIGTVLTLLALGVIH